VITKLKKKNTRNTTTCNKEVNTRVTKYETTDPIILAPRRYRNFKGLHFIWKWK